MPRPTNRISSNGHLRESDYTELVANALLARREFFEKFTDPRRDIDDECGYPATEQITSYEYRDLYDRFSIATRVVELMSVESFSVTPVLYEDVDTETTTEFEQAFDDLLNKIGEEGYYRPEQEGSVHPLWSKLEEADIKSGIGHYGIILLGIDDGLNLNEPVAGLNEETGQFTPQKNVSLISIECYDESQATINSTEQDPTHPRFGQPTFYNIKYNDVNDRPTEAVDQKISTVTVHWSRVVHISRGTLYHAPLMRSVFNRLLDLRKLYGGSAEMYWQGAFPGLSFETHPQLGGDVNIDASNMKDQVEKYYTGLQRHLSLIGMTAKSLSPQVVDPSPQIDKELEAICIEKEVPLRIFKGSERGELASSQDSDTWAVRVDSNRKKHCIPNIICPTVNRLINLGVLPEPKDGYSITWEKEKELHPETKAQVAMLKTDAMMKYVAGDVESIISREDFFIKILGMTPEETESIIDNIDQDFGDELDIEEQ